MFKKIHENLVKTNSKKCEFKQIVILRHKLQMQEEKDINYPPKNECV